MNDFFRQKNDTLLLNPGRIPKAKHMLFKPLTAELIDEYLAKAYKNALPDQYVHFLEYSNGISLFAFKILLEKFEFAGSNLTIYGLPRTQPFGRPKDMDEPFDVRVEDSRRHKNIPSTWLKVGRYRIQYTRGGEADIYIDCDTQQVYSTKVDQCNIEEHWDSFDTCVCDLFLRGQKSQTEYRFE